MGTGGRPGLSAGCHHRMFDESFLKRENYLRRERRYGAYRRSVTLPGGLKVDRAEADFADGILTLTFPKAEEVKPKTIEIKTNHK
jgi:HSP20 family protein